MRCIQWGLSLSLVLCLSLSLYLDMEIKELHNHKGKPTNTEGVYFVQKSTKNLWNATLQNTVIKLTWPTQPNSRLCQFYVGHVSFIQIFCHMVSPYTVWPDHVTEILNKTDTAYEKLTWPTNSNTVNSNLNLIKKYCHLKWANKQQTQNNL